MADVILKALLALKLPDEAGALDCDIDDAPPVQPEHHPSLQLGGRVVKVDDRTVGALEALEGAPDQLVARLGQYLDGNVRRYLLVFDEEAHEVEIGLRGGRKADFDLLEAHADEGVEHAHLALGTHGLDKRLVAVSEIDRAPGRRPADHFGGPLPVG